MLNYEKYENEIIAKAKTYFVPSLEWKDTAQELRIALWKNLPKWDKNKATERTFAHIIMRNTIKNLIKKANRKKRLIDSHHFSLEDINDSAKIIKIFK